MLIDAKSSFRLAQVMGCNEPCQWSVAAEFPGKWHRTYVTRSNKATRSHALGVNGTTPKAGRSKEISP